MTRPLRTNSGKRTKASTAKMPAKTFKSTKKPTVTKKSAIKKNAIKKSVIKKNAIKKNAIKKSPLKKIRSKKIPAKSRASTSANKLLKSFSIVETSSTTWSEKTNGPTFEQVQLAAYHRWLQSGGSDIDNWFSAEGNLREQKDS